MIYLQVALAFLKFVNAFMSWAIRQQAFNEGYRTAFTEQSLAIAKKVASKKQIQEYVDALPDAGVDAALRDLEPR